MAALETIMRTYLICLMALLVSGCAATPGSFSAQDSSSGRVGEVVGEMVEIPGGWFLMGAASPSVNIIVGYDIADKDEQGRMVPYGSVGVVRRVDISPFRMMSHEVTVSQWNACVEAGSCSALRSEYLCIEGGQRACTAEQLKQSKNNDSPVAGVTWREVVEDFIPWVNIETGEVFRLPSEAEWEYAARANSISNYHWGDHVSCGVARFATGTTHNACTKKGYGSGVRAVGRHAPNGFGLYDMLGNVSEWVQDCYNEDYRGAPADGRAWLSGDCDRRMIRGGSWISHPNSLFLWRRVWADAVELSNWPETGFRLAQDIY